MTREEKLEAALRVVLDQVDYTNRACAVTDMVGAVLSKQVLELAYEALGRLPAPATRAPLEETRARLQELARVNRAMLPEGIGFVLLAFDFGKGGGTSRMEYVSNAQREDVLRALLEFLEKNSDPRKWGRHT